MNPIRWLRRELGTAGVLGLAIVGMALAFLHLGIRPLEARDAALRADVERFARAQATGDDPMRHATPAAQLAAFYRFFETGHDAAGWLMRLDGIARESGMSLAAAEYRLHPGGSRIERYEIVLPLAGTYAGIRGFLEKALAAIPVLSLDHVSFRRERSTDRLVEAEARLTLHLLKP